MEPGTASALAVVLGSMVGASATIATGWLTQRSLRRREQVNEEIRVREELYGEFVAEGTKVAIDAYTHGLERLDTILPLYALLNRIKLAASPAVLAAAEKTVRDLTEQYFAPNLSLSDLRELARTGTADPLKAFGQACREELKALRDGA